ncbi:MAG: hypothetical protein KF684_06675 [Phycisphaeraceae bacterium]|nr:hypothetical protein [Phycisphaeraceae bacterium]
MHSNRFALAMRLVAGSALLSAPALAGVIKAEFDDGTSGWTAQVGAVEWADTGGVPGGYLMIESASGAFGVASAPSQFTGALTSYNGGAFTFDTTIVSRAYEVGSIPPIGSRPDVFSVIVTIEGANGLVATAQTAPIFTTTRWVGMGLDFTAATFGVSESDWLSILADVDALTISTDGPDFLRPFVIGFDNIALLPTPGAGVAMLAFAALASRRRRD